MTPIADELTALAKAAREAGVLKERHEILKALEALHDAANKKNTPGLEIAIKALIERGPKP